MVRDLTWETPEQPEPVAAQNPVSSGSTVEAKAAALERRALGEDDPDPPHLAAGRPAPDDSVERAALSDKLDAFKRWALRRDDPQTTLDHPTTATADSDPPLTALERKLDLLDRCSERPDTPARPERPETHTMSQREFWGKHPDEYIPPGEGVPKPDVPTRFRDPRDWINEINPDPDAPGRDNNCGECARATELSWRAVPAISASYGYPESGGEFDARMEEWSRSDLRPASLEDIGDRLTEQGAGSSALVAVGWRVGGGHWFNAVNYNGEVLAVDGQAGTVESWPPTRKVSGVDNSLINESLAITFDKDGRIV